MARPFLRGARATFRFFFDGGEVTVRAKTWKIHRNAVKHSDGVGGEDRDRQDSSTIGYDVSANFYIEDLKLLDVLLKDQENKDAGTIPLEKGLACVLKPIGGGKGAYSLSEVEIDDWDLGMEGRTEAMTMNVPFRARYLKKAPTL